MRNVTLSFFVFFALVFSFSALAEEAGQKAGREPAKQIVPDERAESRPDDDISDTLTGDWAGYRTKLIEAGITPEIAYKADVFSNLSGGIKTGTRVIDNLDLIAELDGEKLLASKGTSALIHVINNNGDAFDAHLVGSAQTIDNIEVAEPTARLFQAWVQQNFMNDRLSVLAGLYALDSEFNITDSSALFIHSAYGTGSEIALTGVTGPATFPLSGLGARIKFEPTEQSYLMVSATDGVPGDPSNVRGTQIELNHDDGAFLIAEAGQHLGGEDDGGKIAVGGWMYTEKFDDLTEIDGAGDPLRTRSSGFYIIGEHALYREPGSSKQGLDGFIRFGVADKDVNRFDYAWAAGLVYTGLIPGRDEGKLGIGIAPAHNSSKYREAQATAGTPVDRTETTFELTYNDAITPWLSVQPDVQYVINPGTDPALDDAAIVGVRFAVSF